MGKYIYLYGVNQKDEHAYVDVAGVKVMSVSVKDIDVIAETLKKLGLEIDEFLKIFRVYDLNYFKKLSSEKQTKLLREASEYIIEPNEIKKIRDFCKRGINKIEATVDVEKIKRYEYDRTPEKEYAEAWGKLKPLLAICEKALELGVKLQVV